jgi:hypothetical protein
MARTLLDKALAERTRNPTAGRGPNNNQEPWWLYKLAPKGEALRDQLLKLAA